MKLPGSKFWAIVGLACVSLTLVLAISAIWFRYQLSTEELQLTARILFRFFLPLTVMVLLVSLICLWTVEAVFRNYIRPLREMAEKVNLINTTNPSYRLPQNGAEEICRLCDRINETAQWRETLAEQIDDRVRLVRSESEREKKTLAAIVSELPEGVLICNAEGRILLYNHRAKQLLSGSRTKNDADSGQLESRRYIGLGRSVFRVVGRDLLTHVLEQIDGKLRKNEPDTVSYFVVPGADNRLLRAEAVPVIAHGRQLSGLILIFYDITRLVETDSDLNLALQAATRGIRASLAGIRAAIETIIEYPQMDIDRLEKLRQIIHRESITMGELLESNLSFDAHWAFNQWPLVTMSVENLTKLIQIKSLQKQQVRIRMQDSGQNLWVKIDSYTFLRVLLFTIGKLKTMLAADELICRFIPLDWYLGLDLLWTGKPVKIEILREWEQTPLVFEQDGLSLKFSELLDHLGSDMGSYACRQLEGWSYLRFYLPAAEILETDETRAMPILPDSRPEFYDFDLFDRGVETTELEDRLLTELTYTVFDMETTGLNPQEGDEILSIGAVRIVNCRLLRGEHFEQLVDPLRPIPWESVKIHGIHPEMVLGKPTIEEALAGFWQFVANTVLLAHNAAFDMRFLQIKEKQTGIIFNNSVLDTLLLSAVVHPSHSDHDIEAIAQRLGVRIVGRHTALGDALAAAEIFLKLLPLLAEIGIYTLKDALAASQKTYYARVKY